MTGENNRYDTVPYEEAEAVSRGDLPMDYTAHLEELRRRLILVMCVLLLLFGGGIFMRSHIISLILAPLEMYGPGITLKYDYMGESIMVQLKAAFLAAAGIALPLAVHQIWAFVKPAVEKRHRIFIRVLLLFAILFFYAGAFFCYRFIAPMTVRIVEQFAHADIPNNINVTNYLQFLVTLVFIFGVIFELPVAVLLLTRLGIVTPKLLSIYRKYVIVAVWIIAALLTPPDVLTQMMIAIPLMVLFEFSVLLSRFIYHRR
ncbi:MAG: twin-arginine translocase subunit TatC [Spirochaetota bacterium]